MQCIKPRQATTDADVTRTYDSALRRLGSALGDYLPQPLERDLFPDGALCALLKVIDVYATLGSDASALYESERSRVTQDGLRRVNTATLVGPNADKFLLDPDRFIEQTDDELRELAEDPGMLCRALALRHDVAAR
eukprot:10593398-Heterocapsa_arctica.AAC.1